jgi:hypothetical protein
MKPEQYRTGRRDFVYLIERIEEYVDLGEAMAFLRSEDPRTKSLGNNRARIDYIPARKFRIPVDSARVIETGTVSPGYASEIVPEIRWRIPSQNIRKNEMMVLDLLDNNNWERPLYYAVTVTNELYLNLHEYFQLQGLAYRIVPIHHSPVRGQLGSIDTDILFENMVNRFRWGGISEKDMYLDENIMRMLTNYRSNFARLANALIDEGDTERARTTLDRIMEVIPAETAPFNYFVLPIIEAYYRLGETDRANEYISILSGFTEEELRYFLSVDQRFAGDVDYENQIRIHTMREILRLTSQYGQVEIFESQEEIFRELVALYQSNS